MFDRVSIAASILGWLDSLSSCVSLVTYVYCTSVEWQISDRLQVGYGNSAE